MGGLAQYGYGVNEGIWDAPNDVLNVVGNVAGWVGNQLVNPTVPYKAQNFDAYPRYNSLFRAPAPATPLEEGWRMAGAVGTPDVGDLVRMAPGLLGMAGRILPKVDSIGHLNIGPSSIPIRNISKDRAMFRETGTQGLRNLLTRDSAFDYHKIFVTDNPALAIGQKGNTGIKVEFRPDSLSGEIHKKPGAGIIGGNEYVTDVLAPRAASKITMPENYWSKLDAFTKRVLKQEFDWVKEQGQIIFNRKP